MKILKIPNKLINLNKLINSNSLIIGIAIILLIIFTLKSLSIDFEKHQKYQNILNQQKQAYGLLDLEVLKSRYQLLSSYDSFVNNLSQIKENQLKLKQIPKFIKADGKKEIEILLAKNSQGFEETERLLENFKSKNAILKNSLTYLPSLTNDLVDKVSSGKWSKDSIIVFDEIVEKTMLYELTSDSDFIPLIENKVKQLYRLTTPNIEDQDQQFINTFIGHVRIVLDNKLEVDQLAENLLQLPNLATLEKVDQLYNFHYKRAIIRTDIYRFFAYILFLIILGVVINYFIRKIVKVNKLTKQFLKKSEEAELALKTINEELEIRVEERTREYKKLLEQRNILIQQQQLDIDLAKTLNHITIDLSNALTREKVYDISVSKTRQALKADRIIIYSFDKNWNGEIVAESVEDNYPRFMGTKIEDPSFIEKCIEQYYDNNLETINNIYALKLTDNLEKNKENLLRKANLIAPIVVENEFVALVLAHQYSDERKWNQVEIEFFLQIASQIGGTLGRINLLEKLQQASEEQKQAKENLQYRAFTLLKQVDPISQGDLTIRAQVTEDEIGTIADFYNTTIENLRYIVTRVQNAALQVAKLTIKNENSIADLSVETTQQAQDINQTLNGISRLTDSAHTVVDNAKLAEVAVKEANESVAAGEIAMNRTVDGIFTIRDTVAETAQKVKSLGESSQKISKVVNLISNFANQTNLLALNASIEAAHAGKQGSGFAVVAEEVRSLARQSAQAAVEIKTMIEAIQEETNEVVEAMEMGTQQVVLGTQTVEETRNCLNQISMASDQINQLITAITGSALEQSQVSEEIAETMTDVVLISTKTSSTTNEVSESFQQLLKVAAELQDSVSKFKVY